MTWVKIFSGEAAARQRLEEGMPQLLILHNQHICLVLHNDRFLAVQDACTHQGTSLSKGRINYLGEIICPLHNYCFNMQTGAEISNRSPDLKTFPVKIDESGFFVGI